MASVNIIRTHNFALPKARELAKQWMSEGKKHYGLEGTYEHTHDGGIITFKRTGISGKLLVNDQQFELDVTLGFLLSVYQKQIVEQINSNMDTLGLGKQ